MLFTLLAFLLAMLVLITVHEWGHYFVARRCGVRILRFSIGFGKPLLRWRSPKSGTEWVLGSLPVGGYVSMLDERDQQQNVSEEQAHEAFNRQKLWKRFAIVLAGPLANFLLAVLLYAGLYWSGTLQPAAVLAIPPASSIAAQAGVSKSETITAVQDFSGKEKIGSDTVYSWNDLRRLVFKRIQENKPIVLITKEGGQFVLTVPVALLKETTSVVVNKEVEERALYDLGLMPKTNKVLVLMPIKDGVADKAGLKMGDQILSVNGQLIDSVEKLVVLIRSHANQALVFDVLRESAKDQAPKSFSVTLIPTSVLTSAGKTVGKIGIELDARFEEIWIRYPLLQSLQLGWTKTWDMSALSVHMLKQMFLGEASLRNISGPVAIAGYAGEAMRLGFDRFLSFLAVLSVSLCVLNLLPIPVLDGGHLLYYVPEIVTGRPISIKTQQILQSVGLLCVFLLLGLALFNDITKFFP